MHIPFVDLAAQYRAHRDEFDEAFRRVIERTAFIGGEFVREFEDAYAREYGVRHCIGVGNGTDAIYIVLKMLGIGAGDEVITTACSWISTSETITQAGARPVFVDVDEFFNIDTTLLEARITPRTKAIIPVHLYGQAANLAAIESICRQRNVLLIEDCAQAHFASHAGRRVGTVGAAATFSFYPGKNLGAYGDAGAIVTNDSDLAQRCRMYANHGALRKHEHVMEGINSRLDGLQAALLTSKLGHIHEWTRKRQAAAECYSRLLSDVPGVITPRCAPQSTHVYHLYVVRAQRREELRAHLTERGIETAIHYPQPLPLLPAYGYLGHTPQDFPRAYRNHREILSLPIFPEMTVEMVDYVCAAIRGFYQTRLRTTDAVTGVA
jgi:dTDP-4-amino-4,6-dideoxygalactose transaminase